MSFILKNLDRFSLVDQERIAKALLMATQWHAPQRRVSGEPYIIHPVAVAQSLIGEFNADADTVISGLLHDTVEDTTATLDDIKREFGETIRFMVDGVTEVGKGDGHPHVGDYEERARLTEQKVHEYAKKDPRIYLVKIADRWNNMITCHALRPKNQVRLARLTLGFHVPITRELGFVKQADELELLCKNILEKFSS